MESIEKTVINQLADSLQTTNNLVNILATQLSEVNSRLHSVEQKIK